MTENFGSNPDPALKYVLIEEAKSGTIMIRASWFFVFFLVTDAFVLPLLRQEPPTPPVPIPVDPAILRMMMFTNLASMFMAFRSVDLLIKTGILMQTISAMQSVTEVMLQQTPGFINGLLDRSVNGSTTLVGRMAQNSCALKLLCELTVEQWIGRQDREFTRRMNVRKQKEYDEKINMVINVNVTESAESESFCERRYRGCPYGVEDISLGLARLRNSWGRWRIPQEDVPFIMDEGDYTDLPSIMDENDYDYLML